MSTPSITPTLRLQQHLPFTVLKPVDNVIYWPCKKRLQQHLPFTVLKHTSRTHSQFGYLCCNSTYRLRYWNIETSKPLTYLIIVATAPTVYGIETSACLITQKVFQQLQQHLPFTVLKLLLAQTWDTQVNGCNSTYRLRYWNLKY